MKEDAQLVSLHTLATQVRSSKLPHLPPLQLHLAPLPASSMRLLLLPPLASATVALLTSRGVEFVLQPAKQQLMQLPLYCLPLNHLHKQLMLLP